MLSLLTNTSALTAQRNLGITNSSLKGSLEKLSSGLRVNKASDDVASMAIGSRLNAELTALKVVSVNAGQATALTQIAEGTYGRINDMLVRMSSLTAQAANGTLSNTERQLLDVEYQALVNEIDRVAADTTFNNQKLVNESTAFAETSGANLSVVAVFGVEPADNQTITYEATTRTFTATINGVTFSGTIDAGLIDPADDTLRKTSAIELRGNDGISAIVLQLTSAFDTTDNTVANDVTDLDITSNGARTFDFRIGSGSNPAEDVISGVIYGTNATSLGLAGTTIGTLDDADLSSQKVAAALNMVIGARSVTGATQNRVDTARLNLATTIENTESAKSQYMDADIAAEVTAFTGKQILLQSGISTLAQANQVPQSLLQLFQQ